MKDGKPEAGDTVNGTSYGYDPTQSCSGFKNTAFEYKALEKVTVKRKLKYEEAHLKYMNDIIDNYELVQQIGKEPVRPKKEIDYLSPEFVFLGLSIISAFLLMYFLYGMEK